MIKSFSIALKRFNCFELVEFLAKVLTLIRATYFSAYRKLSSRLPKIFLKGCDIRDINFRVFSRQNIDVPKLPRMLINTLYNNESKSRQSRVRGVQLKNHLSDQLAS